MSEEVQVIVPLLFLSWTAHPPSPQDTPFLSQRFIHSGVGSSAAGQLTQGRCHPQSTNRHPSRAQFSPAACGVL